MTEKKNGHEFKKVMQYRMMKLLKLRILQKITRIWLCDERESIHPNATTLTEELL